MESEDHFIIVIGIILLSIIVIVSVYTIFYSIPQSETYKKDAANQSCDQLKHNILIGNQSGNLSPNYLNSIYLVKCLK